MKRLYKFIQNERGAVGAIMAITLVVVLGFVAFGVDVGLLRDKRAHLQKAADIAALAGGRSILLSGSKFNRDVTTPVAVAYGRANLNDNDVPSSALQEDGGAGDVKYYLDDELNSTSPNQIEVRISRTAARSNPFSTLFGSVFVDEFDVTAISRVEIASVCSSKCLKPFTAPDKFEWNDKDGDGALDVNDPAEMASIRYNPPAIGGYSEKNRGEKITLKFGNPQNTLVPGQSNAVDLPSVERGTPVSGADAYRENIAGCEGSNSIAPVAIGEHLLLEPGMMIGPTKQGMNDLIAQDPTAKWNDSEGVVNSLYPNPLDSPRVVLIAFYDPRYPPASGRSTVKVTYIGGVFIERMQGNDVVCRFIDAMATEPGPASGDDCSIYTLKFVKDSSRK